MDHLGARAFVETDFFCWHCCFLLYSKFAGGLCAFDNTHDVFLAHHEQLIAFHLHGLPGVLAEQHPVATLDVDRNQLAVVVFLALAHGYDLALVGLLGGGVGNDDATGGLALLFDALDDHAVMQRTNFHAELPIEKRYGLQWLGCSKPGIPGLLALSPDEC